MNREKRIYNITLLGSMVNAILIFLKFAAGFIGNSSAMIADAIHSLSDFVTDIIVILFVHLSNKPADADHDYGHGKYETIATSIIGILLLFIAFMLCWNGGCKIVDFFNGKELTSPGIIAFAAAIMSIVLKEWIYIATRKVAKEVNSKALEANAWHHRSDALSSVGTTLGIGGAVFLGSRWAVLDAVAALVVSIFIVQTAFRLIRQSAGELLEESLPKSTEERIIQIVNKDCMVSDIHNLRTRRIGNRIAIEMHLRLPGTITLEDAHNHAADIEAALRQEYGANTHIMLHLEPVK